MGQLTLQPEQLVFRRADEDVVVEQGTARIDRTAVFVTHLHIGGGEELERRFAAPQTPFLFLPEPRSGPPVTHRKRQHVPPDDPAVLPRCELSGKRGGKTPVAMPGQKVRSALVTHLFLSDSDTSKPYPHTVVVC